VINQPSVVAPKTEHSEKKNLKKLHKITTDMVLQSGRSWQNAK